MTDDPLTEEQRRAFGLLARGQVEYCSVCHSGTRFVRGGAVIHSPGCPGDLSQGGNDVNTTKKPTAQEQAAKYGLTLRTEDELAALYADPKGRLAVIEDSKKEHAALQAAAKAGDQPLPATPVLEFLRKADAKTRQAGDGTKKPRPTAERNEDEILDVLRGYVKDGLTRRAEFLARYRNEGRKCSRKWFWPLVDRVIAEAGVTPAKKAPAEKKTAKAPAEKAPATKKAPAKAAAPKTAKEIGQQAAASKATAQRRATTKPVDGTVLATMTVTVPAKATSEKTPTAKKTTPKKAPAVKKAS